MRRVQSFEVVSLSTACTYGICQNFEIWENTFNGAIILELYILHIRMFHSFRSMNETLVVGWTKDTCISNWNEVLLLLRVPLHMKFPVLGWFNLANLSFSSPWPKLTSHPNKTNMNILTFCLTKLNYAISWYNPLINLRFLMSPASRGHGDYEGLNSPPTRLLPNKTKMNVLTFCSQTTIADIIHW